MAAPNKVAQKQAVEDAKEKKPSSIPDGVLRPQDHRSAKDDVKPDTSSFTFEFEDETYTVVEGAYELAQDVEFLEKLQDGNLIGPLRQLLGFEEWNRAKANLRPESGPLTQPRLEPFFEVLMKALKVKNS